MTDKIKTIGAIATSFIVLLFAGWLVMQNRAIKKELATAKADLDAAHADIITLADQVPQYIAKVNELDAEHQTKVQEILKESLQEYRTLLQGLQTAIATYGGDPKAGERWMGAVWGTR